MLTGLFVLCLVFEVIQIGIVIARRNDEAISSLQSFFNEIATLRKLRSQ